MHIPAFTNRELKKIPEAGLGSSGVRRYGGCDRGKKSISEVLHNYVKLGQKYMYNELID